MLKYYKTINLTSWTILAIFSVTNFVFIVNSAVDIPHWDAWEVVWTLPNLSLDLLFAPHNEHLIVTTKLYTYLLYIINGLNLKYMTIINYFFFIAMLLSLYLILKNYTKDIAYFPLLFIVFFIPSFIINFMSPFLISLIWMTTFGLLAIYFGFIRERNNINTSIMLILMWLSAISTSYSFPTGVMIAFILKEIICISKPNNQHRTYEVLRLIITFLFFILIVLLPFYILRDINIQTVISSLSLFINHFMKSILFVSTLISTGNLLISTPLLMFISIPLITFIINGDVFKDKYLQACYAIIICTSINVAGVSLIRGAELSISSRHALFTRIATPIFAILFIKLYTRYKNKLTKTITILYLSMLSISVLLIIVLVPRHNQAYSRINKSRQYGYDCVQAFYAGSGNSLCPSIYPIPLENHLKKAKGLELSFTK